MRELLLVMERHEIYLDTSRAFAKADGPKEAGLNDSAPAQATARMESLSLLVAAIPAKRWNISVGMNWHAYD